MSNVYSSWLAQPLAMLGLLATASTTYAQDGALLKAASHGDPTRPATQAQPLAATATTYKPVGTAATARQQAQAAATAATTVTFANTLSTALCAGASLSAPFAAAGTFAAGNVFPAQLSNAAGSFAAPVTLGMLVGTSSGTVAATIPAATAAGSGYRVRVASSTTVTATVPTGATSGNVTVATPGGTSNGVAFRVLTNTPVLTAPAASTTTNGLPTFTGTAPAASTVTIYLAMGSGPAQASGTATAMGGNFSFAPSTALSTGTYSVYATAQSNGQAASAQSNVISFTVDNTPPTATLSTTAGSPTSTSPITFSVAFSEPVTGFLPSAISVSNGLAALNPASSSSLYTFTVSPTASGPVTVSVNTGAAQDAVGNPSLASNSVSVQYILATWPPTLTTPTGGTTGSRPTFSGIAAGGSTVTLYAALGSGPTQVIGTTVADANNLFAFTPTTSLADGSYTSYVTAQLSGQVVSANSNSNTFTVNGAALTVTLTSPNSVSGGTTNVLPFTFTATFSQPVTGFSTNGIFVSNGYVRSAPTGSGTTYSFTVVPSAAGATTVTLNAGAAQTAAGSPSLASGPYTLTYTRSLPPLLVLLTPADGSITNGTPFVGGRASTNSFVGITIVEVSTGFSSYLSTASRGGSFSTQFSLRSGVYQATAQAGLNGFLETSNTNTFTVDATAPVATISTTATSPTSTAPIPFTVSFSERVINFTTFSVNITNGTLATAITNVGNDYSFSVTPTANGPVTVTILANSVLDAVGNYNATTSSLSVTYAAPIKATSWTGAVSTDWFDAGNWAQGVPTATVDATISPVSSGRYPLVAAGAATARNLTIDAGASLSMSGGTLDVRGDLTNNSAFVATGGTVVLGTSASSNVLGSSSTSFWGLQVESSGAGLATPAGATVQQVLTLNGIFATNGNSFTLRSNATATALVVNNGSNVVSGTVTVQRAIDPSVNPGLGYRHYAAPVSNSTVADLATTPAGGSFTPTVNSAYNTSATPNLVVPFPTVFGYDDSRLILTNNLSSFDKGFFSPAALSDPLAVGRGYAVNLSARELVDFQGTLNNGDLSLSLPSTRPTYPDGGWQLLGNPYPAPLDYSRVAAADRIGLESAIYIYSSTSQYAGRYRTYVNGIGNPVLPLGQGFFARVAAGQATATMTFRNSQRLTAPNGTSFQRPTATADPRPLVQLELRAAASPAAADEFYAYAESGATAAFDSPYDAIKVANPTGFSLTSTATSGELLAIDSRPAFTAATALPLTVGVPATGTYALSAAALANLPFGLDAYLADDLTGQTIKLRPGTSYSFSVSAAQGATSITGRFRLVFRPATALATAPSLTADVVGVYPNPAHERFTVTLPGLAQATTVQAELLNALGQVVRRQAAALPASGTQLSFETAGLATGVYTLRLQADPTTLAKRVVVE